MSTNDIFIDNAILDEIVEKVETHANKKYKEYKQPAIDMIEEYITKYNLIVYGYMAMKELLNTKKITKEDSYMLNMTPQQDVYYNCYSIKGRKNVGDLIKNLQKLNYRPIRSNVIHGANNVRCQIKIGEYNRGLVIIEIVHITPYEYNKLIKTSVKIKKGNSTMNIISPLIVKIQLLNRLIDPLSGFEEWKRFYMYKLIFDKYYNDYNIFKGDNRKILSKRINKVPKIFRIIEWIIFYNLDDQFMFLGNYIYKMYVDKAKKYRNLNVPNVYKYTITAKDADGLANKIVNILKKNSIISTPMGKYTIKLDRHIINDLEIKKYDSTIDLIDQKFIIKLGKKVLLDIYQLPSYCIPYLRTLNIRNYPPKKVDINISNYYVLLRYYYGLLWDNYVNLTPKNSNFVNHLEGIIKNVIYCRENYLKYHRELGIEKNNIFKVFNSKCLSTDGLYTDIAAHNVKLWEYKKKLTREEYNKIKSMCQPINNI